MNTNTINNVPSVSTPVSACVASEMAIDRLNAIRYLSTSKDKTLTATDFSTPEEFTRYTFLTCNVMTTAWTVINSMNKVSKEAMNNRRRNFSRAVYDYAHFWSIPSYAVRCSGLEARLLTCCVKHTTKKSDDLIAAEKSRKAAAEKVAAHEARLENELLREADRAIVEQALEKARGELAVASAEVQRLLSEPMNRWSIPAPYYNGEKVNPTGEKYLLEAIYDCREAVQYLTVEEIERAAADIKKDRKERAAAKKAEKKSAKNTVKPVNRPTEETVA